MGGVYYNEFDPFAAAWLRNLIAAGQIAPGDVDERSIKDVSPDDLKGYTQLHFFAGIGGWSYAARLAGWPDDRPLWTGSCPCQPFSTAGKGLGRDDPRHLWPDFFRLIRACRPAVVMGEQTSGKAGYGWLDGVRADLAGEGYASRGVDIPACAVDAPHIRQRLYWIAVADAAAQGLSAGSSGAGFRSEAPEPERLDGGVPLAHASSGGPGRRALQPAGDHSHGDATGRREGSGRASGGDEGVALGDPAGVGRGEGRAEHGVWGGRHSAPGANAPGKPVGDPQRRGCDGSGLSDVRRQEVLGAAGTNEPRTFWSSHAWIECHDGKARRVPEPGFPLLASGLRGRVALGDALGEAEAGQIPEQARGHMIHRVGAWRGFGNAIEPHLAAEVIRAWMDCAP